MPPRKHLLKDRLLFFTFKVQKNDKSKKKKKKKEKNR